jgi:hypothetical protein
MILKFMLIMLATFMTCWIYFLAAMAAVAAITVKVRDDRRR